jgi:hypothetical protein
MRAERHRNALKRFEMIVGRWRIDYRRAISLGDER